VGNAACQGEVVDLCADTSVIKSICKMLLALCAFLLALPLLAASERAATLRAINWVENPTNHARPGSRGELGPYQFLPHTWRMHTRVPFQQAVHRAQSDAVAVKHYEWIKSGLVAAGIDPNPFNIALAWNCGLSAVTGGRIPAVSYGYAERVQNLVEHQRASSASAAIASSESKQAQPATNRAPTTPPLFIVDTSGAPRFTVAAGEPLYEPVVRTNQDVRAVAAEEPTLVVTVSTAAPQKPAFVFSSVANPPLALVR